MQSMENLHLKPIVQINNKERWEVAGYLFIPHIRWISMQSAASRLVLLSGAPPLCLMKRRAEAAV